MNIENFYPMILKKGNSTFIEKSLSLLFALAFTTNEEGIVGRVFFYG